jgi:hypothetical protein
LGDKGSGAIADFVFVMMLVIRKVRTMDAATPRDCN